jgi:GDP/UDP-N,N'-diacetylbacillosamine 2-epimerase (hydrolysing)
VVNIGTRQHGRLRAENVVDVPHAREAIESAVRAAVTDADVRQRAKASVNPYGDGTAAAKTVAALKRLHLGPALIAKWIASGEPTFD